MNQLSYVKGYWNEPERHAEKRRVRNQIISYIVAVLILAGIVTGGVMGIRSIASAMEEKKRRRNLRRRRNLWLRRKQ